MPIYIGNSELVNAHNCIHTLYDKNYNDITVRLELFNICIIYIMHLQPTFNILFIKPIIIIFTSNVYLHGYIIWVRSFSTEIVPFPFR